ncbi:MAG: peptide chain release factor N(5)-glutamine methyltransferase [Gammaproteobacteria bacterium]|nr:peptide chain release factor N(5)-glutamine methyltransferase [Gammaproteobacteria bacterium]
MTIIKELLADGENLLTTSDSARLDSEILLAKALEKPRSWLYGWPEHVPTETEQAIFLQLLRHREKGVPVAYLTGKREFWGLVLKVNEHVLIPRPETELLVEKSLELIGAAAKARVADLGTGSGAIAMALATERPAWEILATDISTEALSLALENATELKLHNVQFFLGNWLKTLEGKKFDAIASNPPYIEAGDKHLAEGDVRFEPELALVSGKDGLDAIRQIARDSINCLTRDGWLLLEHGFDQGDRVRQILIDSGYSEIETFKDLAGHERVSVGSRKL